jgi:hypothetical protein
MPPASSEKSHPFTIGGHERREPMPRTVLVDLDTGRYRWQLFGPYDGNTDTSGQAQPPAADRKPSGDVLPRKQGPLAALEFRQPATVDFDILPAMNDQDSSCYATLEGRAC